MQLGFALTQHCNLRCPHCIRDDITTVRALEVSFIERVIDEARDIFGDVTVSLTGGEPLLHPQFGELIDALKARALPWRFVSNGWHIRRALPHLERHPPQFVRLSLSGGDAQVHDAERGRGSFERVLLATAMLTSRGIPSSWSLLIDKRSRHQIERTAELAESLGCIDMHYILPQPTPSSAERDSDIDPREWLGIRREVDDLASRPDRKTAIFLDYGAPSESGEEQLCFTMKHERIYIDAHGRLSLCCQLSDYGSNETDVVADLNVTSLHDALPGYMLRMRTQIDATRVQDATRSGLNPYPCMRCARASGKLAWLNNYPESPWHTLSLQNDVSLDTPALVHIAQPQKKPRLHIA